MRVTFEYDLANPEDNELYRCIEMDAKVALSMWAILDYLDDIEKNTDTNILSVDCMREKMYTILEENGVAVSYFL